MVKVTQSEDNGSSPKHTFLQQFNTAFAEGDVDFIAQNVSDDIVWNMVGSTIIEGKAAFVETLHKIKFEDNAEVVVNSIVVEGMKASANGDIVMSNGKRYAFCDMYAFADDGSLTIKSITSYNIEIV